MFSFAFIYLCVSMSDCKTRKHHQKPTKPHKILPAHIVIVILLLLLVTLIIITSCINHEVASLHACILIILGYSERVSPLISPWKQIRADSVIKRRKWCHLCLHMTSLNCALNISASSFVTRFPVITHSNSRQKGEWERLEGGIKNNCQKQEQHKMFHQ